MSDTGKGFWDAFVGRQPDNPNSLGSAATYETYLQNYKAEQQRQEQLRQQQEKKS